MKADWMRTDLAKECVKFYGNHNVKIYRFGKIGFVEYCQLCGEGQYVNLIKEPGLIKKIHIHMTPILTKRTASPILKQLWEGKDDKLKYAIITVDDKEYTMMQVAQ